MLRNKFVCKCLVVLLLLCSCAHNASAHENHNHRDDTPVCIRKSTYSHFQRVLTIYQDVYRHLVKNELSEIPVLSQKIIDAPNLEMQTEKKGNGRHMMGHILLGAQNLNKAESVRNAHDAFASITNAFVPFFYSWPAQLKHNGLKLYSCEDCDSYWLQHQDEQPVCPYTSGESGFCSAVKEVKLEAK